MKIIIATHKQYWMPTSSCYLPLHVGREGKADLGYVGDNTGDNISTKNASYCELTGLYWAWKNLKEEDAIGLVHYRRHFVTHTPLFSADKKKYILQQPDYENLLKTAPVILPKKRNYFIETSRSQYEHAHNPNDILVLEQIIKEQYPECSNAFNKVMNSTSGHRFNMFVMQKEQLNNYCHWLFTILFELEKRIDVTTYNKYNSRVFGFLSERMLDIWLTAYNVPYTEQKVAFLEHQNWPRKITKFLIRKLKGGEDFTDETVKH